MDNTIWQTNPTVTKRIIDSKNILIDWHKNKLLIINNIGKFIWESIDTIHNCSQIDLYNQINNEYEIISENECMQNINDFCSILSNKGFLIEKSEKKQTNDTVNNICHSDFSDELNNIGIENNIPITGCLEITQKCPLKCVHCYIDNRPINNEKELNTEEIKDYLNQIASSGCLWLLITGGEPLARNDFSEIYIHAKKLGMIITIFTSAVNIDEKMANLFIQYPPFLIESTLHSYNQEKFDKITRTKGSFIKFIRGINLLKINNIPFHLKSSIMKYNFQDLIKIKELADKLGADDYRYDPKINADFHQTKKINELRIGQKDVLAIDCCEPYKSRWQKIYNKALTDQEKDNYKKSTLLFPCHAGKSSFVISAESFLLPCIIMREPKFNLRQMSFSDAWEKMYTQVLTSYMKNDNKCLSCEIKTCSKCPAWGYLETGDANKKSEYMCQIEKNRELIFLGHREEGTK
jgi:MoaA/NifB/PqqE/SkfB family radical SAM enzyme